MPMPFRDRRDAGRRLADELTRFAAEEPIVLVLPRGGAPVASEVAIRFHARDFEQTTDREVVELLAAAR